jgi:mevalonate pyrophosphate decarboxylase
MYIFLKKAKMIRSQVGMTRMENASAAKTKTQVTYSDSQAIRHTTRNDSMMMHATALSGQSRILSV